MLGRWLCGTNELRYRSMNMGMMVMVMHMGMVVREMIVEA